MYNEKKPSKIELINIYPYIYICTATCLILTIIGGLQDHSLSLSLQGRRFGGGNLGDAHDHSCSILFLSISYAFATPSFSYSSSVFSSDRSTLRLQNPLSGGPDGFSVTSRAHLSPHWPSPLSSLLRRMGREMRLRCHGSPVFC